jgi:hypothetical protein
MKSSYKTTCYMLRIGRAKCMRSPDCVANVSGHYWSERSACPSGANVVAIINFFKILYFVILSYYNVITNTMIYFYVFVSI